MLDLAALHNDHVSVPIAVAILYNYAYADGVRHGLLSSIHMLI